MRSFEFGVFAVMVTCAVAADSAERTAGVDERVLASIRGGAEKFCAICISVAEPCAQCVQVGQRWVKCNNPASPTDWQYVQGQSPAQRVDVTYLNACGGSKLHYYNQGCTGAIDDQMTVPCDRNYTVCTALGPVPGVNCP